MLGKFSELLVWIAILLLASPIAATAQMTTPLAIAEANTVSCVLQYSGAEYSGTCDIPCAVNALAINIDGVRPGFACSTPPRRVSAVLQAHDRFDDWLGTTEGKESTISLTTAESNGRGGGLAMLRSIPSHHTQKPELEPFRGALARCPRDHGTSHCPAQPLLHSNLARR
jgi:hypothetical protein